MEAIQHLLKEVEEIRYNFSIQWGNLIYETGAVVLVSPNFYNCLEGFLYIAAKTFGENALTHIKIKDSHPFIEVLNENDAPENVVNISKLINKYTEFSFNNKEAIISLYKKIEVNLYEMERDKSLYETEQNLEKGEKFLINFNESYERNRKKILNGKNLLCTILNMIGNLNINVKKFKEYLEYDKQNQNEKIKKNQKRDYFHK